MKNYLKRLGSLFIKKAFIDVTLFYKGSQTEFMSRLEDLRKNNQAGTFYLSSIENNKFNITDIYSTGILILNFYRPVKGISIDGEFNISKENKVLIRLTSKLRIEIYIFLILALGFYLVMILSSKIIPWYVYFFPIIPVPWFIWIYKLQTVGLLKKIISYFGLQDIKNNCL
jgi:hypothetical protein